MNYKEEVLKQFPNAVSNKPDSNVWIVSDNNNTFISYFGVNHLWKGFYEKYCTKETNIESIRKEISSIPESELKKMFDEVMSQKFDSPIATDFITQPTMKLTREDFEGLEVGAEITTLDNRVYKFNHIVNDLVFMINSNNKVSIVPIDYMNQHYFTIQKPKQYYQGWEIGDYSGKNVWVQCSDYSEKDAKNRQYSYLLKKVTDSEFITEFGSVAKYAVQLTEVNTEKQCNTQ